MTIGEQIKNQRNKKKMTQSELANALGLATITIRQYETGKRQPRLGQLTAIAEALDVDVYSLIDAEVKDMGLNERLKKARVEAGLTQADLAKKLGLTVAAISKYETGQRQPRLEQLAAIAKELSCTVAELLGETVAAEASLPKKQYCPGWAEEYDRMARRAASYDSGAHYLLGVLESAAENDEDGLQRVRYLLAAYGQALIETRAQASADAEKNEV